ncbi:hypothetical protein BS78_05G212700 [Paspalum vaginatum]|nr:hypothetical protein BS78_05G212700 [Paspalum vaginatum]
MHTHTEEPYLLSYSLQLAQMEVVTGVLPRIIAKLGELLIGEYNLQRKVKGEIRFLQSELKSMHAALEGISDSKTQPNQLGIEDKIWARDLRELSYDIEDSIDTFVVRGKGNGSGKLLGIRKFIDRSVGLFRRAKVHHGIATEIRDIKSRVIEVHKRRRRYKVSLGAGKPVATAVDPRLFTRYTEKEELVGIDEARDELIKILTEDDGVPAQKGKIVSIVGFGGLGKTTLANAVYEKIRERFDCCAFVPVSQTPDLKKLFKCLLYYLGKNVNEQTFLNESQLLGILREFLQEKRYFIVIDDIWDIKIWTMIRNALPNNDTGYIIITTTRVSTVAEEAGVAYKLRPLSLNNSRKLLYGRIFGDVINKEKNEDAGKCPDKELEEVSDRILKKCAGVPLAITTMASLLTCKARNKMEWYEVYNSIGTGLELNLDAVNMRNILLLIYYDLPYHLRTCLLYLSVFPEDHKIDKRRLIWMWISEGFIQCDDKQGNNLFDLGQSYFDQLINRSMIQPLHDKYTGIIEQCRVHDMVLDLIRSLSSEENFITVLNDTDLTSQSNTTRRLSIQNAKEGQAVTPFSTTSLEHVRSVIVFPPAVDRMPDLGSLRVLRVLNLEGCNLSQGYCIRFKHLGNLFHLRYLGLQWTGIGQLPREVGNMHFLQTLIVTRNKIPSLPPSALLLRNLMCLYIDQSTRVPSGIIGNLRCLHELSMLRIDGSTMDMTMEELGQLTELRWLSIFLSQWSGKVAECLSKLQKIQRLFIRGPSGERNMGGLDAWVAPARLCTLGTGQSCCFTRLPAWMDPSLLPRLTALSFAVRELRQDDLETLGRMGALCYLNLEVDDNHDEKLGIIHGRSFVFRAGDERVQRRQWWSAGHGPWQPAIAEGGRR